MKTKVLRQTVRTYEYWELEEMLHILTWDEFSQTKQNIIKAEMKRREKEGNNLKEIVSPKVSLEERLALVTSDNH